MHKSNQYLIRAQKPNVLSFLLNRKYYLINLG